MNEENYRKDWEETRRENQQMDSLTDARIKTGIEKKIKSGRGFKKLYWAAAAALIIGFGLFIYVPSSTENIGETSKTMFYASADSRKQIHLEDGTHIIMEPQSTLTVSDDFGKTDRKISFTGKATFDIAKDKSRPFLINAKDFTVQILGTKFFLDQTNGKQKVELYEGKVKINHHGKITYLLPNEKWEQNPEITGTPETQYYAADVRKNFIFGDEKFETIISRLEKMYNMKIQYPEQYKDKRIKGSFSGNLNEVLSAICYPFNLNPKKISENEIQLK